MIFLPPAARGKAHGAWRFAHSTNRIIRFAPCALRYAHNPLQKLLIKGGHGLQPERIFRQTMTAFGSF
jgi:hypothetical protein